jgi:hypothetical protein
MFSLKDTSRFEKAVGVGLPAKKRIAVRVGWLLKFGVVGLTLALT